MHPKIYKSYSDLYSRLFKMVIRNGYEVGERNSNVVCKRLSPICYGLDLQTAGDPFFYIPNRKWGLQVALAEVNWILNGTLFLKDSNILEEAPPLVQFMDESDEFFWAQYGSRMFQAGAQESIVDKDRFVEFTQAPVPIDQMKELVKTIKIKDGFILPSRRLVISIWSPFLDLVPDKKDYACNVMLMFNIRNDRYAERNYIDISVIRRSNDIIWGIQNNFVQFWSVLMEFIHQVKKHAIFNFGESPHTIGPGYLYEFNHNLHYYTKHSYGKRYDEAVSAVETWSDSRIRTNLNSAYIPEFESCWPMVRRHFAEIVDILKMKKKVAIKNHLNLPHIKDSLWNKTNLYRYLRSISK